VDESGGSWGTAQEVPGSTALHVAGYADITSVSCESAGDCVAGGDYTDSSRLQAFVVDESGGSWGTAQQVPGSAALNTGGSALVRSVSCASAGICAAGGRYTDSSGHHQAFVVDERWVTGTAMSLSAPAVTYGDEQAEQVTIAVSSASGTPDGTVTVNAGTITLCTITLASGGGSCALLAAGLPAGTAHLTAAYSGSADFATSVSAPRTLAVSKAATNSRLTRSRAKVAYGDERAERLTVIVTAPYGLTPRGKVVIKARRRGRARTVCVITLAVGKGRCALSARELRVGIYRLVAHYLGGRDFTPSTAAAKIKVIR
jgi:hypothetical protein